MTGDVSAPPGWGRPCLDTSTIVQQHTACVGRGAAIRPCPALRTFFAWCLPLHPQKRHTPRHGVEASTVHWLFVAATAQKGITSMPAEGPARHPPPPSTRAAAATHGFHHVTPHKRGGVLLAACIARVYARRAWCEAGLTVSTPLFFGMRHAVHVCGYPEGTPQRHRLVAGVPFFLPL